MNENYEMDLARLYKTCIANVDELMCDQTTNEKTIFAQINGTPITVRLTRELRFPHSNCAPNLGSNHKVRSILVTVGVTKAPSNNHVIVILLHEFAHALEMIKRTEEEWLKAERMETLRLAYHYEYDEVLEYFLEREATAWTNGYRLAEEAGLDVGSVYFSISKKILGIATKKYGERAETVLVHFAEKQKMNYFRGGKKI